VLEGGFGDSICPLFLSKISGVLMQKEIFDILAFKVDIPWVKEYNEAVPEARRNPPNPD